jgi:hypothetical protein
MPHTDQVNPITMRVQSQIAQYHMVHIGQEDSKMPSARHRNIRD